MPACCAPAQSRAADSNLTAELGPEGVEFIGPVSAPMGALACIDPGGIKPVEHKAADGVQSKTEILNHHLPRARRRHLVQSGIVGVGVYAKPQRRHFAYGVIERPAFVRK